jgi:hypothetical protein
MATLEQKEQLMEVLKFTPRTYKISMWGYGGEKVMGTVSREIYDYFKNRRLDLSDYAWDSEYANEHNIPEEMQPFPSGSWYECDDMAHENGVSRDAGTLQIEDENGNTVIEKPLEECDGCDNSPELLFDVEAWIDEKPAGTIVFLGSSNEKGTFFEGEFELRAPFDITKLTLHIDEIDSEEIISGVSYDGVDIDNWGGSTDGKSSNFGFYVAGSQKSTGKWEVYKNMDDIEYEMTEWFPKKIKPVRNGVYMVKTAGKNSYTYQARWTGARWISSWHDDVPENEEIKIKEWQGLTKDPDANLDEQRVADLEAALEELKIEFEKLSKDE